MLAIWPINPELFHVIFFSRSVHLTECIRSFHLSNSWFAILPWNLQCVFSFFRFCFGRVLFIFHLVYQRPKPRFRTFQVHEQTNTKISGLVKNCMQSFECVVITQTNYISSKFMVFILKIRRKMVRIFGNRIEIGFLVFPFDFVLLCVRCWCRRRRPLRSLMFISRSGYGIMKQADLSHGTDLNYAKRKWFYLIASIFFIEGFVLYSM